MLLRTTPLSIGCANNSCLPAITVCDVGNLGLIYHGSKIQQHAGYQLANSLCPWNSLRWRQNGHDSVSNNQPRECLLNRLIRCRSKKTLKLRVTGLCVGNSPETGGFPAQRASNAENVSIWWRHHVSNLFWWLTLRFWNVKKKLTHWGRDKMAFILQTRFLHAFSWTKLFEGRLKFSWSLFRKVH